MLKSKEEKILQNGQHEHVTKRIEAPHSLPNQSTGRPSQFCRSPRKETATKEPPTNRMNQVHTATDACRMLYSHPIQMESVAVNDLPLLHIAKGAAPTSMRRSGTGHMEPHATETGTRLAIQQPLGFLKGCSYANDQLILYLFLNVFLYVIIKTTQYFSRYLYAGFAVLRGTTTINVKRTLCSIKKQVTKQR